MKEGLKLKIGSNWCALKDDTSINIEMTSPLWNDSGSFSYPFTIPYEANRHIFNSAELPESDINLKTFRERFELYVDGIGLLFGEAICTAEEIDLDGDSIELELRSGNASLNNLIEGKTLRDLDYSDVLLGYYMKEKVIVYPQIKNDDIINTNPNGSYPIWAFTDSNGRSGYMYDRERQIYINSLKKTKDNEEFYQIINTIVFFPFRSFINIPISVQAEDNDGVRTNPYVLSANRAFSSPCLFLLDILNRIFKLIHSYFDMQELSDIEDMKRLILLNTSFKYKEVDVTSTMRKRGTTTLPLVNLGPSGNDWMQEWTYTVSSSIEYGSTVLSGESLPNVSLSDFINSFKDAFGVRFINDNDNNYRAILLRDVFTSDKVLKLKIKSVHSITKIHEGFSGIKLKYSNDDDDEFNYNGYKKSILFVSYHSIINDLESKRNETDLMGNPYLESDTMLRVCKETGNFYRVKVDRDKYDNPELFEVGQFNPYKISGYDLPEKVEQEEMSLPFTPVIPTVVNRDGKNKFLQFKKNTMPTEALFVDAKINLGSNRDFKNVEFVESDKDEEGKITFDPRLANDYYKEILSNDCGFLVGVCRSKYAASAPSDENYSVIKLDADNFGNNEWVPVVSANSVTSDSVTHSGEVYDYNGGEGGIGYNEKDSICLKLWNGKQNLDATSIYDFNENGELLDGKNAYDNNPTGPFPNRGLVPQFLKEYFHFRKNRKIIEFVLSLDSAEIKTIKWENYYDISGYRCFIDKISFSLGNNGIGVATVRAYCI